MATSPLADPGVSTEPDGRTRGSPVDVAIIEDLSRQRLPARTLAAVLGRAGVAVHIFDFGRNHGTDEVLGLLLACQPALVVSSILFADLIDEHLHLIQQAKHRGLPSHWTMVGHLPSLIPAKLMDACPYLDSVLCGEAEMSIVSLATGLLEAPPVVAGVPGLATRSNAGNPTPFRPLVVGLDSLPDPLRTDSMPGFLGSGYATLEGSRGCRQACAFCLPSAYHTRIGAKGRRSRSIGRLLDEIETLYRRGVRLFLFDDEQFLPAPANCRKHIAGIQLELERRGLQIAFTIKCRPDEVDLDLFFQLKAIGLIRAYVGIESGCRESLDVLSKRQDPETSLSALATLHRLDIVADFRCLLFHPWSTLEMVSADIGYYASAQRHIPSPLDFREVEVYPGTPMAKRLASERGDAFHHWTCSYACVDPRAELLRRMSRVVFFSNRVYIGLRDRFTQAWYAQQLGNRYQEDSDGLPGPAALRVMAAEINQGFLNIFDEMVALAGTGSPYDPETSNRMVSDWGGRVSLLSAEMSGRLPDTAPQT
jgi:anaerobic magnesium-protoporphyrin IX monomethyl ester cyclase